MIFQATFHGRVKGAIGISHVITTTVKGENEEAARLALYEGYEHVLQLKLTPPTFYVMGGTYRKGDKDEFALVSPYGRTSLPYVTCKRQGTLFNLTKHHAHEYALLEDGKTLTIVHRGEPNGVGAPPIVILTDALAEQVRQVIASENIYEG